ncbi:MAG: hypothetical protein J6P84_04215 [Alphaproteobacteria bacterium]|nr:hypothetical protein [Clostridia bacterium]MBO6056157.1 hypothetical protein [Alphaproteobacteria bacterium]
MKTIYLDIDAMRQILSHEAFDIYMGCFNAVYLVLAEHGSFWYEIHDGLTSDVVYVWYSTKELNNYYLRMKEVTP